MGFGAIQKSLSKREKEVLRFVADGYPASYIAGLLKLSCRTVENYIASIKCKLTIDSKVELIQKTKQLIGSGYFDLEI